MDSRYALLLILSVLFAWIATEVTVELRSPADRLVRGATLDSAVLVGLVVPVAVLGRSLQNRLAWLAETSPRSTVVERFVVVATILLAAGAVAVLVVWLAPQQLLTRLIVLDLFMLLGLAITSAVLFGASQSWVVPATVAFIASTPGLLPIQWNVLANGETQSAAAVLTLAILAVSICLYLAFDDYGIARRSRLLERMPGITDE